MMLCFSWRPGDFWGWGLLLSNPQQLGGVSSLKKGKLMCFLCTDRLVGQESHCTSVILFMHACLNQEGVSWISSSLSFVMYNFPLTFVKIVPHFLVIFCPKYYIVSRKIEAIQLKIRKKGNTKLIGFWVHSHDSKNGTKIKIKSRL